jgi:hypothetical protein
MEDKHFNNVKRIVGEASFPWTIPAFTRILPRKGTVAGDEIYTAVKVREKSDLKFERGETAPEIPSSLYDVSFLIAHGTMTNTCTNRRPDTENVSVLVPDDVVMVRVGMVGKITIATALKAETVQAELCGDNLNVFALNGERRNLGCDIVPPGYPVQNMMLGGYGNTFTNPETKETYESWAGVVHCTENTKISFESTEVDLKTIMSEIGKLATIRGRKALFILVACHETINERIRYQGTLANVQALNDLPVVIRYVRSSRPPGKFQVHEVIELATQKRMAKALHENKGAEILGTPAVYLKLQQIDEKMREKHNLIRKRKRPVQGGGARRRKARPDCSSPVHHGRRVVPRRCLVVIVRSSLRREFVTTARIGHYGANRSLRR